MEAQHDSLEVSLMFGMGCDFNGFFTERRQKLHPVYDHDRRHLHRWRMPGTKGRPQLCRPGNAAAARVIGLISQGTVMMEPIRASINKEACSGCRICNDLCPYNTIVFHEDQKISEVITALCQGCGTCAAACPSSAITGALFTNDQVLSEIEGILWDVRERQAVPA